MHFLINYLGNSHSGKFSNRRSDDYDGTQGASLPGAGTYQGRLTLPGEIRNLLQLEEGDDMIFTVDESGRVIVQRLPVMDPDQVWFWSERWQAMEQEAQADIEGGRVTRFNNVDEAVSALGKLSEQLAMPEVELTERFIKTYKKLPHDIHRKIQKAIRLLGDDPSHPSLRCKPIRGAPGIFEASVDMNYRLTYERLPGDILRLSVVGPHDYTRNVFENDSYGQRPGR